VHHLGLPDVRPVLDFLWRVRSPASPVAFVELLLQGMKSLIPCDLITYNEFHAPSRTIRSTVLPTSVLPPGGTTPVTRHYRDHPLLVYQLRTGDGRPRRLGDVGSMRIFRGTALFSEVYRPARIPWEIAMTLPAGPGTIRCVALHRGGRDFSDADVELLALVRPYLAEVQQEMDRPRAVHGLSPHAIVGLSPRERDVLSAAARGKTNAEIGAALKISSRTVQKHLEHVYDKVGVRRRAGAVTLAHDDRGQHPAPQQ
jgi:DNA-binding CsgD family transcriptional regulator